MAAKSLRAAPAALVAAAAVLYLCFAAAPFDAEGGLGIRPLALPLEALVFIAAALALDMRRAALAHLFAGLLLLLTALAAAEAAALRLLGRPLDLAGDVLLLPKLIAFLAGAARGWVLAGAGAALIGLTALAWRANLWALRVLGTAPSQASARRAIVLVLAVGAAGGALTGTGSCAWRLPLSCDGVLHAADQLRRAVAFMQPDAAFDAALAGRPEGVPLSRLGGADLLLVFVESYGVTAIEQPALAGVVRPALDRLARAAADRGLSIASGRLEAPTVGGLSWLSHATLLSGLWIDSERRYGRLVASDRRTLVADLNASGYRTAAVLPQTLKFWPEGRFFGHDRLWWAGNIPYAGPSFGWTTMPDQYTLWFAQQAERATIGAPRFVEIALISSHAPWDPVPPLIEDWERLGDGAIFSGRVPAPAADWMRSAPDNYSRSIAYSLDAVAGFAHRFVDAHTLLIVLGDHQPAALITGAGAGRAVPIHVLSGEPRLVRPFLDWGFVPGAMPSPDAAAHRMDAFRDFFVAAFSGP